MSHYTVLVVGSNPEDQLQPFHEFECTGEDDQYIRDIDITEEVKKEGLDYYGLEDRTVTDLSQVNTSKDHKYGYALVDQSGNIVKAIRRTNPNKKWDWYSLGGRWSGFFLLKNGRRSDQAAKGEIDFETERNQAGNEAAQQYDRLHAIVNGREIPSWDAVREQFDGNIEEARRVYKNNDVIKDIMAVEEFRDLFIWDRKPYEFAESRADFIEKARNSCLTSYALLKDGQWFSRGEMGWFGFSHDKMTQDEWNKKFSELLDSLPDDTLLSIYDCHI